MPFVLDASVTGTWMYKDEDHPDAAHAFDLLLAEIAVVPSIWWFEVRNLLIMGERRKRFSRDEVDTLRKDLDAFPIEVDHVPDESAIFDLARRHGLTFYDGAYLELAIRRGLPLATLDGALIAATRAVGVALVESA
jgi:predicted nucleic acid-binding protein